MYFMHMKYEKRVLFWALIPYLVLVLHHDEPHLARRRADHLAEGPVA